MISAKHSSTSANLSMFDHPDLLKQAIQFRQVMGQEIGSVDPTVLTRQLKLVLEEASEFEQAVREEPKVNQLKELADLVYVAYQYAVTRGWELGEALNRVHESNMSKLVDGKPLRREDGKILKGPAYAPPYLDDLT